MTRLIASALVFALAAPVAGAASFAPDGVDLFGPDDCCCPEDEIEDAAPPEIDSACCCELRAPTDVVEASQTAAIVAGDQEMPPQHAIDAITARTPSRGLHVTVPPRNARAPPPGRSLFAQYTSLLL